VFGNKKIARKIIIASKNYETKEEE